MGGGDTTDVVRAIALRAHTHPDVALAEFAALWRDHRVAEPARTWSAAHVLEHQRVRSRLVASLELTPLEEDADPALDPLLGVTAESWLAALSAVDEHLWTSHTSKAKGTTSVVEVGGVRHLLRPRPRASSIAFECQQNHLQHWMLRHWVHPAVHDGIEIVHSWVDGELLRAFERRLDGEYVNVFVASFADGVVPNWSDPTLCGCDCLGDDEMRRETLRQALDKAAAADAHIVVFPELTVTETLRSFIADWLETEIHGLVLVAAGSFHVERGGFRRNIGWVLDGRGRLLYEHVKLLPQRHAPPKAMEAVEGASILTLLGTPVGLLATPICLDFCELAPPLGTIWDATGIEIALVPSMGGASTMSAHIVRAKALSLSHGTVTAVAAQPAEGDDPHDGVIVAPEFAEPQRMVGQAQRVRGLARQIRLRRRSLN